MIAQGTSTAFTFVRLTIYDFACFNAELPCIEVGNVLIACRTIHQERYKWIKNYNYLDQCKMKSYRKVDTKAVFRVL